MQIRAAPAHEEAIAGGLEEDSRWLDVVGLPRGPGPRTEGGRHRSSVHLLDPIRRQPSRSHPERGTEL